MKNRFKVKEGVKLYKEADSLVNVDYSDITPMIVVYDRPRDIPDKVVARVWSSTGKPTNVYVLYETLQECREDAYKAGFEMVVPRHPSDDACIVETYHR